MTAVARAHVIGRRTLAAAFHAAVDAAIVALVLATAAGCRGAPATPTSPATPATSGTPTALALTAYRDRVATAAAILAASPTEVPGRTASGAQARARATTRALVDRPVSVTLRAAAVGRPSAAADGASPSRLIVAAPLAPASPAASTAPTGPTAPTISTAPLASTAPEASAPAATADADLAARLAIVRDEVDASARDATADHVAALDRVLADRAFDDRRSLAQRAWDALRERFAAWWGDRALPGGTGAAALRVGQAIGWAVALVVIVLTAVWTARIVARLTDAARVAPPSDGPPSTPAEARARAEADAGAGDYRSAVRQLYLAALLVLEGRGLLRADRSRTNREQLAALAGGDELRAHMAAVVATFDRVWYGVTVPDGATFRTYSDDVHQLEALAKRAPDGAPAGRDR